MSLQQPAQAAPEGAQEDWQLASTENAAGAAEENAAAEAVEQQQEQPPALTDLQRVAIGLGWTPKNQWRGDLSKWTDEETYIKQTGQVLERTKNDLRLTRRQMDEQNARLARIELGHQSLEQQRAQELNAQYEEAKFEAAKAGDQELYGKLLKEQQTELAKLQPKPQTQARAPSEAEVYAQAEQIMSDPIAQRFFEGNPVALQDEQAWALMDREMTRVAQAGGGAAAQFRAAEEALRYAYPSAYAFNGQVPANGGAQHHSQEQPRDERGQFTQQQQQQPPQQRRPAPPMNAASPLARSTGERSAVDQLPAEARAHLERAVKSGEVKDKERWAQTFLGNKVVVRGKSFTNPNGARA